MKSLLSAALLTALLVSACGTEVGESAGDAPSAEASSPVSTPAPSDTDTPSSEPSETPVKPASGKTHRLEGLTLTTPKGWSDVGEQPTADTVLAVMHTGVDDTPERLSVRRLSATSPSAAVAAQARQDLKSIGAVKIKDKGVVSIADQKANYSTAIRDRGGVYQRFHQYVMTGDDTTWVLTFSVNRWQQKPDPQQVIDSILMTVDVG